MLEASTWRVFVCRMTLCAAAAHVKEQYMRSRCGAILTSHEKDSVVQTSRRTWAKRRKGDGRKVDLSAAQRKCPKGGSGPLGKKQIGRLTARWESPAH